VSRKHGWILLSLGLILAVGTGAGLFLLLRQQQRTMSEQAIAMAQTAPPPMITMAIPVAARPLAPGTVLSAEDLLLKEYPLELVPISAITSTVMLESQLIVEPIGQGETISSNKLAGESAARISQQLAVGQMLFAFPIADLLSRSNVINDGDRIDLLLSLVVGPSEGATDAPITLFTLQNLAVIKVLRPGDSEPAEPAAPVALLLGVTPEEAVLIKHVKDAGGVIDFVLRSPLDSEPVIVPPVSREDLITRFGVR
jgi:pilus assembly protein CpaB